MLVWIQSKLWYEFEQYFRPRIVDSFAQNSQSLPKATMTAPRGIIHFTHLIANDNHCHHPACLFPLLCNLIIYWYGTSSSKLLHNISSLRAGNIDGHASVLVNQYKMTQFDSEVTNSHTLGENAHLVQNITPAFCWLRIFFVENVHLEWFTDRYVVESISNWI